MTQLASTQQPWQARLELGFSRNESRTVLSRRRHHGPLVVQRPFYPEQAVCHTYLLHPPGGIVGGDQLEIDIQVATGAHALITTPAATKFYRSAGEVALLSQSLVIEDQATLEWLPQETIYFEQCKVRANTRAELQPSSRFIGWEISSLGRPASGEGFQQGSVFQTLELWLQGTPLLIERNRLLGGDAVLEATWGLKGHSNTATMVCYPATNEQLQIARDALSNLSNGLHGVTLINNVLVCRCLTHQAMHAKALFEKVWQAVRPSLIGRPACAPRIWST